MGRRLPCALPFPPSLLCLLFALLHMLTLLSRRAFGLTRDQLPLQAPLGPPLAAGSYPQYAKPASLLRMFELFLAEAEQSDNSRMPTILSVRH